MKIRWYRFLQIIIAILALGIWLSLSIWLVCKNNNGIIALILVQTALVGIPMFGAFIICVLEEENKKSEKHQEIPYQEFLEISKNLDRLHEK